jgi:hypothetical protein
MPPTFRAPILPPARRPVIAPAVAAAVASTLPGAGAQTVAAVGGPGLLVEAGVRRARVAGDAEVLVAGRAAHVTARGLVVGAGLYGLSTRAVLRSTLYGGVVLGYAPRFGRVRAHTDAPAGGSRAPRLVLHTLLGGGRLASRVGGLGVDDVLVTEPGVQVALPLAGDLRLAADAGWRFVAGVPRARRADIGGLSLGVGLQLVRF